MKELGVVKAILPKVFQERDFMWEEVKSYREMNMLFNYEINMLKRKQRNQTGLGLQHQLPWYFGHCISYAVLASVLLGAAVSRHLSVTDPLAARRDALQSTVILLREDAGHLGNATVPCTGDGSTWNSIEEINSDKSIDRGRPSLALRSSSCRSGVQEPEVGSSYVDRSLEHNSSLVVCSSSALEAKARSSLDADREHRNSNPPVTDSNDVEDVLPNHISFSEELRLQGLGKWLQHCRVMLHHVAGTPERAWLLFSLIFILETIVVAIFRPKTIKLLNATYQQVRNALVLLKFSLVYLGFAASPFSPSSPSFSACASVAASSVFFSSASSFHTSPAATVSSPASAVISSLASSFHSPAASCSTFLSASSTTIFPFSAPPCSSAAAFSSVAAAATFPPSSWLLSYSPSFFSSSFSSSATTVANSSILLFFSPSSFLSDSCTCTIS
ncbi:Calpain-type cysteine protease DEK1 [Capsicum baccatum]|uniref:Calpain-type cysteine protease DEK1 n=1 Tax=Capsicum baccatum TaxID=33114 RepID=A0A2G2V7I9_CAPBA|nr:Calpain-type cysteine protease DEK1 [Capsicum baccatum]